MATSRQAFFARFSRRAREAVRALPSQRRVPPLVLLTGGLRSPEVMHAALQHAHADILGVGRGSVLCPDLPRRLAAYLAACPSEALSKTTETLKVELDVMFPPQPVLDYPLTPFVNVVAKLFTALGMLPLPKLIGAGVGMAWYVVMMRRLAQGMDADLHVGGLRAVFGMWEREIRLISVVLLVVGVICMLLHH